MTPPNPYPCPSPVGYQMSASSDGDCGSRALTVSWPPEDHLEEWGQIFYKTLLEESKRYFHLGLFRWSTLAIFLALTLTPEALWLETFLNPQKSINVSFGNMPSSSLMACTSCQVVILPHLKRWIVPVSNSAEFSPQKVLLGGFWRFWWWG